MLGLLFGPVLVFRPLEGRKKIIVVHRRNGTTLSCFFPVGRPQAKIRVDVRLTLYDVWVMLVDLGRMWTSIVRMIHWKSD